MSYYVDIIDQVSNESLFVIELASRGGITLEWNGGDKKDELSIVASSLYFDLAHSELIDAKFIKFFTGNEIRFKVELRKYEDDALIWQGHLIPDTYSEPYTNSVTFVKITAACGLARLKGKYLPAEYYNLEKSLVDIYCTILGLTGLQLDMYLDPAIENFVNKDWDQIFIDTSTFKENNKRQDAYKILETLLNDTLCMCYQADGHWYIEGVNKRHLRKVSYKIYDVNGVFQGVSDYNRVLKKITALVTPDVTMVPPYNQIEITHAKKSPSLPKEVSKETNNGWAIVNKLNGQIYPTEWISHGGLYAKCFPPDYYCNIQNKSQFGGGNNINYPQDDSQWVSLREKIFFSKSQKIKIAFSFGIKGPGTNSNTPSDMNLWKNPFKYEFTFNDLVIFSNFGGTVSDNENVFFSDSGEAKLEIEHIFKEDGLFDIKIYGPPGTTNTNRIEGILIKEASIDVIGFKEEEIYTDLINDEFTIDKEIELTYADDNSGFSKGFRLQRLKDETEYFNTIEVPILYGSVLNGKNYSVVGLQGANLIAENMFSVYKDSLLVNINDVVYNYNNGEEMVIETDVLYNSGSFFVKKYAVNSVVDPRTSWMQWSDSVYKIENFPYAKTVANIYRRMFAVAHEKLDIVAYNAVKFNDIILFKYVYEKDFIILNCSWNIDANKTTLTLARSSYGNVDNGNPDANIPPVVVACDDIYLNDTATTALISAVASDPDGYIASQIWTKTDGPFGDVIMSQSLLSTSLQNLTGDFYTYQIKVTDNDGAEAMDTVNVIRTKNYTVTLLLVEEYFNPDVQTPEMMQKYKLVVTPNILENFILTFNGVMGGGGSVSGTHGAAAGGAVIMEKNGVIIAQSDTDLDNANDAIVFNYIATDEIFFTLSVSATAGDSGSGDVSIGSAYLRLSTAVFTQGLGTILGLPIDRSISVSTSS